jgi:hypothetical protein
VTGASVGSIRSQYTWPRFRCITLDESRILTERLLQPCLGGREPSLLREDDPQSAEARRPAGVGLEHLLEVLPGPTDVSALQPPVSEVESVEPVVRPEPGRVLAVRHGTREITAPDARQGEEVMHVSHRRPCRENVFEGFHQGCPVRLHHGIVRDPAAAGRDRRLEEQVLLERERADDLGHPSLGRAGVVLELPFHPRRELP